VALTVFVAFVLVERTAENPIVPLGLFFDRNRLATFAAMSISGGVAFTMAMLIALYVQNVMGYGPMRAAIGFIPFTFATFIGVAAATRLVMWFAPRVVVIAGSVLLIGGFLSGSTLHSGTPYPHLVLPMVLAGVALGMINVPLGLSLIASVGVDQIGPASAISVMLRSLAGPLVLGVVQAVITSRTLHLGGTRGPVKSMTNAQLDALDHGFAYGWIWLAAVVVLLCGVALLIGYTAQQVAHAQKVKQAIDAAEL
jgi:Na+/melibiose symporter-like transporter